MKKHIGGIPIPQIVYSKPKEQMTESELRAFLMTPQPFHYPLSVKQIEFLLAGVKGGTFSAGDVFFFLLVPSIKGMMMPIPGEGEANVKYGALYVYYRDEVVHGKATPEQASEIMYQMML